MCGIAGRFNLDGQPVTPTELRQMTDAIVHRGPDDQGHFAAGGVGLAMRRLSIIDLAGGHQPMQNERGTVTIVFNGEIYNYKDVRRDLESRGYRFRTASDTESILHAYEEYGPDCVTLLNGMFAFALWDARRDRLFIARDRIGIKPLYIYQTDRQLRFASEVKALLVDESVPRRLDQAALSYFLRYGYVAPPATLLKDIRKLPPATSLLIDRDGVTARRYWALTPQPVERGVTEHAQAVYETLKASVRRQLVADVPLGAFLSGGLDSSSIVHLMSDATGTEVNTYSIGFEGEDAFHSELSDARAFATRYRTNHHEIVVRPDVASLIPRLVRQLDEPLADSSFVVTFLVSELAVQTVKVILSGVGGDELFGGYRRYLGPRLSRYWSRIPHPLRRLARTTANRLPVDRGSAAKNYLRLARSFLLAQDLDPFEQYDHSVRVMSDEGLARLLGPNLKDRSSDLDCDRHRWFAEGAASDPVGGMMHLDLHTSLVESLLLLTDKMTMATSLEARVPFLDHEMVEEAARIPAAAKVQGTELRHVQRVAMRGHLPDEVFRRRKRGFGFPIGAWFRKDLREMAADLLSPVRLGRHGLFDPAAVQHMLEAHQAMREDYSDALLALLTFELWYDQAKVTPG